MRPGRVAFVSRQLCSIEGEERREGTVRSWKRFVPRNGSPRTIKMHFLRWLVARRWSREKVFNRKQLERVRGSLFA